MIPITQQTMFFQGDIEKYLDYYLDQLDKCPIEEDIILSYYKRQVNMYGIMSLRCLFAMMVERQLYRECSRIKKTFDYYVQLWNFIPIPPLENEVSDQEFEDYFNMPSVYNADPSVLRYSRQRILITCISNILVNRVELTLKSK